MLFDLADTLHKKRRLLFVVAFISIDFWLLAFCSQTLQTHRPNLLNQIHNNEASLSRPAYQNGTVASDGIGRMTTAMEAKVLRATVAASDGIAKAERGTQSAIKSLLHTIRVGAIATVRAIGIAITTVIRVIATVIITILRVLGVTLVFVGKAIIFPFTALGKGVAYAYGAVAEPVNNHLGSVIRPLKNTDAPVITPEQAQQVSLIQENTLAVAPIKPAGSGGACDNGAGNGGYPMEWCDARMDTIRTVSYSSDRINRQCTSYAYWYFTTIEGNSDFRVSGNANRWARTSNYPTHATPAVGAIAVQTAGYYGHVAIVQALPGQLHDGKIVPEGYVLVSEMNYDWQGHFRYSYSPLSKFSTYIYP